MILLALLAEPWAEPVNTPDLWSQMLQGRLALSLHEEASESVEIYSALLRDLSPTHALYAELMYWLGRAQYEQGDTDAARSSLLESRKDTRIQADADAFLREMGAWEHRIRSLPYEGKPWVGPLGQYPAEDAWEWMAGLDIEASRPSEIMLELQLGQESSLIVTLRDWEGGNWLWQEQVGAGEQSVRIPVDSLQPPHPSAAARFRSLSFRVQGVLPDSEPRWNARILLR
jgi:hypothetical protein